MDSRANFILGRGEKLTGPIQHVLPPVDKVAPYTVDEAQKLLEPQFQETVREIDTLPDLACPRGETVVALTLHPEYIAKSYYPEKLLQELGVVEIGSRATLIKPKKWAKKKAPEQVRSVTLFVRGSRDTFRDIPQKLQSSNSFGKATDDLIKIEQVKPITNVERVRPTQNKTSTSERYEVVLHASADVADGFIIEGFEQYVSSLGLKVDINRRLFADGLCFMSMDASSEQAEQISSYSFVRVMREMPQIRPIPRGSGTNFKINLPTIAPIDPSIKVAVFDGGIPANTVLEPWVRRHDTQGVGNAHPDLLYHGTAVTGALLFGPLSDTEPVSTPYCYVDHYRVLDDQVGAGDIDLIDVVKRIQDVLEATNYRFINLSLGPDMTVDDDEPHVWSTILDRIFVEQDILAAVAVGNTGARDKASGNARVQPPSDCVNAMAVGAADSAGDKWQRAAYSSIGPGRAPGIVKPDIVTFGGSSKEPFYVVEASSGNAVPETGTSFASPASLRTALGIRAHFGDALTPMALKALLLHAADDNGHDRTEVGWGRAPLDFRELMSTDDHAVRVLYQGVLSPAESIKAPIPLTNATIKGKVEIKATIVYMTPTNPQDTANYTNAGLDVVFRPHSGKKKKPATQIHPDPKPFFSKNDYELFDDPLSYKAHIWETARTNNVSKLATSLHEPAFNLHYNARDGVGAAKSNAQQIRYAMVVTVSAPKHPTLYNEVFTRYRSLLEPLKPVVQIPVRS